MEYSKDCAIPYLSRVDAGTIELVRSHGVEVVSSGDLIQRFEAVWDDAALATHQDASVRLYRIKDRALAFVRAALAAGRALTEYDVQQEMVQAFRDEDLCRRQRPGRRRAGQRRQPALPPHRRVAPARRPRRGAAARPVGQAADAGRGLRRHHLDGVHRRRRSRTASRRPGRRPPGRATPPSPSSRTASPPAAPSAASRSTRRRAQVLIDAGFAAHVLHRTGHSLGEEIHGNGVHMDDYETHDDRRLVPGLGFTIEPGLYFDDFGIRTEINMTVGLRQATVTGDIQREMETLA